MNFPTPEECRAAAALAPAVAAGPFAEERLPLYLEAVGRLMREAAARGENNVVIKYEVEDYPDEAHCGHTIAETARIVAARGFSCAVSYDTHCLKFNAVARRVVHSIMRNPKIIALTIAW